MIGNLKGELRSWEMIEELKPSNDKIGNNKKVGFDLINCSNYIV